MIVGFEEGQIDSWKSDIKDYKKEKRNYPAYLQDQSMKRLNENSRRYQIKDNVQSLPPIQIIKEKDVKTAQTQKNQQIKLQNNKTKYIKNYDIITCQQLSNFSIPHAQKKLKNHAPLRNLYNVINGEKLSDQFLQDRTIVLPRDHQKRSYRQGRDFNIVTGEYKQKDKQRKQKEKKQKIQQILNKYNEKLQFNHVYCRYYNPEKQEQFLKERQNKVIDRNEYQQKLPLSYKMRQKYIQDFNEPISNHLKQYDERQKNAKKRYRIRHIIEMQSEAKNIENYFKKEALALNKYKQKTIQDSASPKYYNHVDQGYSEPSFYSVKSQIGCSIKSKGF